MPAEPVLCGGLDQQAWHPCVVRDTNMGHQFAGANGSWVPKLESWTTHPPSLLEFDQRPSHPPPRAVQRGCVEQASWPSAKLSMWIERGISKMSVSLKTTIQRASVTHGGRHCTGSNHLVVSNGAATRTLAAVLAAFAAALISLALIFAYVRVAVTMMTMQGCKPACSRRRDCHFADIPSPSTLKHLLREGRGAAE